MCTSHSMSRASTSHVLHYKLVHCMYMLICSSTLSCPTISTSCLWMSHYMLIYHGCPLLACADNVYTVFAVANRYCLVLPCVCTFSWAHFHTHTLGTCPIGCNQRAFSYWMVAKYGLKTLQYIMVSWIHHQAPTFFTIFVCKYLVAFKFPCFLMEGAHPSHPPTPLLYSCPYFSLHAQVPCLMLEFRACTIGGFK